MGSFNRIPQGQATLDSLTDAIDALHDCLHQIADQAAHDRELAEAREELRRERHESIKEDLSTISRRVGVIERWQETFAKSFGMRSPDDARLTRRILGIHYGVILGWLVALLIGLATGPVGYFVLLKMLPAAVHAALSVAP